MSAGRIPVAASKLEDLERVLPPMMSPSGERPVRVVLNHRFPEGKASRVRLGYPHDPLSGETVPQGKRRRATHTGAAIGTQDKELRHVEMVGISTCRGTLRREHEPS